MEMQLSFKSGTKQCQSGEYSTICIETWKGVWLQLADINHKGMLVPNNMSAVPVVMDKTCILSPFTEYDVGEPWYIL
jgi:hypothetical protein